MDVIVTCLTDNKEWLFSGAGVVFIAWIYRIFFKKKQAESNQTIRAGEGSTNVQSARDVHVNIDKRVKKK